MTIEFTKPQIGGTVRANILVYGPAKVGKSALAGTAPPGVLYLNADLPNATRYVHARNPDGRILEVKLPPYNEERIRQAQIPPLLAQMNEIELALSDPKQKMCRSVVIDPVGDLHRRLLEEVSFKAIRPKRDLYGDVAAHIERFCRNLCMIPHINTIIVCHELTNKDEATGEVLRIPFTGTTQGSPSLGQKLMGMVDVVGYCGVRVDEEGAKHYRVQLFSAKGRQGGDRFNCLGNVADANISEWLATVERHERQLLSTLKETSTRNGEGARPQEGTRPARTPQTKETSK